MTILRWALLVLLVLVLPVVLQACAGGPSARHWSQASWDSAGVAPDPATTREAVVQVYAARTWGRKGIVAVHSWVIFKPEGASRYTRYDVAGWGVASGRRAVRQDMRPHDGYWAGNPPELLAELRGNEARAAIPKIQALAAAYPYDDEYRLWPGPNSNTFVAEVGRAVPELRLDLPPTAVGKDYLPWWRPIARAPSGTGLHVSLLGALGFTLALEEGIELHLLGMTFGLDLLNPAIKLPALGRVGFGQSPAG